MGRNDVGTGSDDEKRLSGMCEMPFRFRHNLTDSVVFIFTPSLVQPLYTFHPDFDHG